MLVPFIIGTGVGAVSGASAPYAALAVLLCFTAMMSVFLARQPLTLWVRIARGRGRRTQLPAARMWSLALLAVGAAAGAGLLALGRWPVLWLAIPALGVLAATVAITMLRGPRLLLTELIGVAGLALAAPAAAISVTGRADTAAWLVWAITAVHNIISVLYVRLRIDERHERATTQQAMWVVAAHAMSLVMAIGAAILGYLPALLALPAGALLLRALIVAQRRPPIQDVKRFGFTEMGMGLAFALLVIAAFAL